jgi:hypothetical protein
VLQTQLVDRLPSSFLSIGVSGDTSLAYALIPEIPTLQEPLKTEVRVAFAESLKVIWQVFMGVAGIGLLASLFMKGLPLHNKVDRQWALEDSVAAVKVTSPSTEVDTERHALQQM